MRIVVYKPTAVYVQATNPSRITAHFCTPTWPAFPVPLLTSRCRRRYYFRSGSEFHLLPTGRGRRRLD